MVIISKPSIRSGIQPKMLDLDPKSMNPDPKHLIYLVTTGIELPVPVWQDVLHGSVDGLALKVKGCASREGQE